MHFQNLSDSIKGIRLSALKSQDKCERFEAELAVQSAKINDLDASKAGLQTELSEMRLNYVSREGLKNVLSMKDSVRAKEVSEIKSSLNAIESGCELEKTKSEQSTDKLHHSLTEMIAEMKKEREDRARFEKELKEDIAQVKEDIGQVKKDIGHVKKAIDNLDNRWFLYWDTVNLKKTCPDEEEKK